MNNYIKPYPLGYIFSDFTISENKIPDQYNHKKILNHYNYYYDNESEFSFYEMNNSFILIHGHFVHVGLEDSIENAQLPEQLLYLYLNNSSKFLDTLDYIGGRFIIIIGNKENIELYPDATNSRSTYFKTDENICSSHAELLGDIFNLKKKKRKKYLNNNLLMSPFETINSVFPNYKLNLYSKEYERFFPRKNNVYKTLPEEKRFQLIERFWDKQLQSYLSKYDNFIFSLTGGGDSRFSFSLIQDYKDKINFFTYASTNKEDYSTDEASMLSLDYVIVNQLLKYYDINHTFLYFDQLNIPLTEEEIKILDKNSINKHTQNIIPFIHNKYPYKNLMHIRANLLELGQARDYRNKYVPNTPETAKQKYLERSKKVLGKDFDINEIEYQYDLFVEKLGYGKNTFDYHIMDLNYWEIRMGRWHAEVINNHDVLFDTISPYNHRALIDITLTFPYDKRKSEYVFKEIINRNDPILNFFGDNNIQNLYEQHREIILNPPKKKPQLKDNIAIIKSFSLYNENGIRKEMSTDNNIIYIPEEFLNKNNYAEKEFIFSKKQGIVYLNLESKFGSKNYKSFIFYEILKNNEVILKEDVSNWNLPNSISVEGLKKGDSIKIRVVINKKLNEHEDWQKATKVKILNYLEINSFKKPRRFINYSSPYSREL